MKYQYKNTIFFAVLMIAAIVLSIPTIALHTFQPSTGIVTTGSDILVKANSTEKITISINITNSSYDYLNQTNITVPTNSTDYANYSINWSTLAYPSGWTCTNETDLSGNVSKIICNATSGNELQYLDISFNATAFNFNDSNHIWTIDTMDNNSETNTRAFTTKIGIVPTLSEPNPTNGTVMTQYFGNFSVNVTDQNLNTTSGFIFFRNKTNSVWRNQSLVCSGTSPNYTCSSILNLALFDGETVEYYFAVADKYAGYGYNWTNISYLNVTVNISAPESIPYIILMPLPSSYYNQSYDVIGTKMNATINNNSYIYTDGIDTPHYASIAQRSEIVYFDERTINVSVDNSLATILAAYDAKYVTVILPPQHVTPNLIRNLNTLFSSINADPFVDVAWGVVTGKYPADAQALVDRSLGTVAINVTTYDNYYAPDSLQFTGSSVFAPLEQAYQSAATTIYNLLNSVGLSGLYIGDKVTPTTLYSKLDESSGSNVIYFAGGGTNTKLYVNSTENDLLSNDLNKCPFFYSSNDSVECQGKAEFSYFKNRLVFFSTSDYFTRLASNDTYATVWDMNNANSSDWTYHDSLILNMLSNSQTDGPLAFIGSVSSTWVSTENFAKTFFSNLIDGGNIGSALSTSKNMLRLNKNNILNQTTKDFISYIDDSYVLYGMPQVESKTTESSLDFNTETILQIDTNPTTDIPISWNLTLSISPKSDIGALYSLGQWDSTKGTVWFYNVTEPSDGKINISFISALNGEYYPDPSAYNVSVEVDTIQNNFTQTTVEIKRTKIIPNSNSTEQYNQSTNLLSMTQISDDDFKYDLVNNKSLIFAILYSANETLPSSYSKTVNLTFKTEAVSIETLSIKGKDNTVSDDENNITIIFNLVNPTELVISNLTLKYPVPEGVLTCIISGPNVSGLCINATGFILQNISQLSPGKTQYILNYIVSANMTNTNNIYYTSGNEWQNKSIFNWGDNVTIKSTMASSSSFDAEIITEMIFLKSRDMINSSIVENTIVWSNLTTVTLVSAPTLIEPIWSIPVNTSESEPGEYLIKVYVLENTTSKYLLKNIIYVNITDKLALDVSLSNVSSTSETDYISEGQINLTISGSVKKQSGEFLNGSLIGESSIAVYFGENKQGDYLVTDSGQLPTIKLENLNFNPGLNTITVTVFDEFNNSDTFDYLFNVTNIIDSIIVKINNSDDFIANEDDFVQIKGTIKGDGKNVFNANVSIYHSVTDKICDTKTDESGVYSCDWQVPHGKDKHSYTITVNATSPLDVETVVSNSTNLHVVWLDVTIDSTLSDIGVTSTVNISKDVTVIGSVTYSDDSDLGFVEGVKVSCFINDDLSRSDGWNKTPDDYVIGADGKYACTFLDLNHTGTYYVTISAINESSKVRGYIKDNFKIIYTAPQTDSGSGTTSPPSTTIPPATTTQNDTTDTIETTDTIDIRYNKTLLIQQGTTKYIEITVTNKKNDTIHNLDLTLDGVTWSNWYDIQNADITELAPNASATFMINLNIPETTQVDTYTINANIKANETEIDETISFTIQVSFSDTNKVAGLKQLETTETLLYEYNDRISSLLADISDQNIFQRYFGALNGTIIGVAKDKIFEAKKLLEESRSLLETGNTAESLKLKTQANSIISEAEKMISDEESKLSVVSELFKKALLASFLFIVLIAVLGYMLAPPKTQSTYTPKGDFFNQKIKKKTTLHLFSFKKIATKFNRAQDKTLTGRSKIDQLHERFKSYLKDDN